MSRRTVRLGAAIGLALVAALACRPRGGRELVFPQAPLVLISIDTLRSDRLPAYGYRAIATPAIDRLARDGILYERAYSHIPLTLPSHASLLSGRLPGEHGVRDNVGFTFDAAKNPYLPHVLSKAGYATGAAVSAFVLRRETGLGAGFDFYQDDVAMHAAEVLGRSQRPGGESLDAVLPWLDSVAARPFFLFLHLYEPHSPYEPPAALAGRYREPYDGEVVAADAVVGRLLARLAELGLYDRALIVLLSDHGEGLGDHGEPEHGILLYREALQVPLLVKLPGAARGGERIGEPAQLIDLFPTVVEALALPADATLSGRSLLRAAAPRETKPRPLYAETYYPRFHYGWSELTSLIEGNLQLIEGPDPELYDLVADPGQRTNLRATERRAAAELRERLRAFHREPEAPAAADEETARQLAALGYLSASTAATSGPLPDPKSRLPSLRDLSTATQLFGQRRHAEALPLLERAVRDNPLMVDAWDQLGRTLQALGRPEAAVDAFKRAMEISQGSGQIAVNLGYVLLELGRLDEAYQHAELALPSNPSGGRLLMAQVSLARGDLDRAEREASEVRESFSRPRALLLLAKIGLQRGNLESALGLADEALALASRPGHESPQSLDFVRGDILARLGRAGDAEQAFLREIATFPADPKAYGRLAVLYTTLARPAEAVAVLRRLVDGNPDSPAAYAEAIRTLRVLGQRDAADRLEAFARRRLGSDRELRALLAVASE